MEKLGLDFFYKIKTVKIPIDTTNYTANLPNDYISYSKIGVLNSKGEIIPLKFKSFLRYFVKIMLLNVAGFFGSKLGTITCALIIKGILS